MNAHVQAAREQFERAREIVAFAYGLPSGNAQQQIADCDLAALEAITAAGALPDPQRRREAVKGALADNRRRLAQIAREDAQATIKRQERDAACRRVLENGLGYAQEDAFAALAVLDDDERIRLAVLDGGQPVDPREAQAVFDRASARIQAAALAPVATSVEPAAESAPAMTLEDPPPVPAADGSAADGGGELT